MWGCQKLFQSFWLKRFVAISMSFDDFFLLKSFRKLFNANEVSEGRSHECKNIMIKKVSPFSPSECCIWLKVFPRKSYLNALRLLQSQSFHNQHQNLRLNNSLERLTTYSKRWAFTTFFPRCGYSTFPSQLSNAYTRRCHKCLFNLLTLTML